MRTDGTSKLRKKLYHLMNGIAGQYDENTISVYVDGELWAQTDKRVKFKNVIPIPE